MKYKQALQSLPSDFKRKYGVSPETFWFMVQAVRDAKQGSRGSDAKLSIPDRRCADARVLERVQNTISYSTRLGNT
jgi:3-hydroxy-3-methylglutaryl CoA synthase